MGKKKVAKQTEEEVLKETENREAIQKKKSTQEAVRVKDGSKVEVGRVYIQSSYNNTLVSVTDLSGNLIVWGSAGSMGFRGPKKATPFAATKIVENMMEKLRKVGMKDLHIFVKGIGSGRDAAVRAFGMQGFNMLSIKDMTPMPHNGCRPRKPRRV